MSQQGSNAETSHDGQTLRTRQTVTQQRKAFYDKLMAKLDAELEACSSSEEEEEEKKGNEDAGVNRPSTTAESREPKKWKQGVDDSSASLQSKPETKPKT